MNINSPNSASIAHFRRSNRGIITRYPLCFFIVSSFILILLTSGCKTCECPAYSYFGEKTKIKITTNNPRIPVKINNIILAYKHIQKNDDQISYLSYQKGHFTNYLFNLSN